MKAKSDIEAMILNAVIANTKTKIVFRMAEPTDAAYLQRVLFLGHTDYAEYKLGTERPVAVGHDVVIVHGTSEAEHVAEHQMQSQTTMHGRAHAHGTIAVESSATASSTGSAESAGDLLSPPLQFGASPPNASAFQMILAQNRARSSSRSDATQSARSHGTTDVMIESEGEAHGIARGRSVGRSHSRSQTEQYITRYESLPSELYSATEQAERLTGEIMTLADRECFVKFANQPPLRTRTADLNASFRSAYCKRIMLPIYEATRLALSPYLQRVADVDAQIAGRSPATPPLPPGEPDLTKPEPMPVIDQPDEFAATFWRTRKLPNPDDEPPKPKPKKPRGRRPLGDLKAAHDRFRVVDGDKDR